MINYIKSKYTEGGRVATSDSIHHSPYARNLFLLRYTDDFSLMPIVWTEYAEGKPTGTLLSNIPCEVCNINNIDLSRYVVVSYSEISNKHTGGKTVEPRSITSILHEYKEELRDTGTLVLPM